MDLFDTTQSALERAMSGTSARQAALAENLANANTPGYQRKDVDFESALRSALGEGKGAVASSSIRTVVDTSAPLRADGSNVDPEREGSIIARAGLEHDALVSIVTTRNSILRAAMGDLLMGIFDALDISASGLIAERTRMDVTSQNLANAQSSGYRRQDVVLRESGGGFANVLGQAIGASSEAPGGGTNRGVEVSQIVTDQSEQRRVYDPGHPDADAQGYVRLPNVNPVSEMTDLISASRAYEANVTAMNTAKQMFSKTLEILR